MRRARHAFSGRERGPAAAAAAALALALAGCGSSHHSSTTARSASAPANPTAAITQAWTQFFSGKTSAQTKQSLLQNGDRFAKPIAADVRSPLAQQAGVQVTKVSVVSPTQAKVTYTILLAGKPVLKDQSGTAVLSAGKWKVSDTSFCALLALQGAPPAPCPKG